MPTLKFLNGVEIKKLERKDCEIYYMKDVFHDFFKITG